MPRQIKIISTKKLRKETVDLFENASILLNEFEFIRTSPIDNVCEKIAAQGQKEVILFTSGHAVQIVAQCTHFPNTRRIYTVGKRTASLAEKYFGKIEGFFQDANSLAAHLISIKIAEAIFFCGNIRREELPKSLREKKIRLTEVVVYETALTPHFIENDFDAILFFSPSAVESFFSLNSFLPNQIVFTTGNTTSNAARLFCSNEVVVPENASEEAVANAVISRLKN